MGAPIYQVDAFTDRPFRGNPAGVCLLEAAPDEDWMQDIAREMNVSETAFVWPAGERRVIRYFTPAVEVPLCGHATLAAAHTLWESGAASGRIELSARGGHLAAEREGDWIRMDFPADPVKVVAPPSGLAEALQVKPESILVGRQKWWLVELASEGEVRDAEPDFAAMRRSGFDAAMITARAEAGEYDFVSRFFAPGYGIDEDPATGAAHTCLTPFWSAALGKTELVGLQVSKRTGVVRVRDRGERVDLLGQAVTVLRGTLMV